MECFFCFFFDFVVCSIDLMVRVLEVFLGYEDLGWGKVLISIRDLEVMKEKMDKFD